MVSITVLCLSLTFLPHILLSTIMDSQLAGNVVLVTGASGGIGAAIARAFAAEGAKLVLHYRRSRAAVAELARELPESLLARADLAKESEVKRVFARALERFGRIDTLIANAASWESRDVPFHNLSLRQWRQTADGVLTTTFLTVREFFRVVAQQRRGNAVLVSSTAGVFGEADHADYAACKSAVAFGLTRSLKNELARLAPHTREYCGGRVNCICPGWTVVPRVAGQLKESKAIRRITATMALPQLARPEDIAHAAVFLSSDRLARHITGQTLVVAGGMEGRRLWSPEEIDVGAA
jgi:3-oxoacyl-[acyl-carrier protein] reductase